MGLGVETTLGQDPSNGFREGLVWQMANGKRVGSEEQWEVAIVQQCIIEAVLKRKNQSRFDKVYGAQSEPLTAGCSLEGRSLIVICT